MSRALSAQRHDAPAGWRETGGLPLPSQLAALGTVLCLYRPCDGELGGWRHAVSAHACQGVDSDGIHESLCFLDAQRQCRWRLYLLPDSDFLAWDRLVSRLPARPAPDEDAGVAERLWRRLALRLGGQGWRMCALRLLATDGGQGLAASLMPLSPPGAITARRIAREEGAEGELWLAGGRHAIGRPMLARGAGCLPPARLS